MDVVVQNIESHLNDVLVGLVVPVEEEFDDLFHVGGTPQVETHLLPEQQHADKERTLFCWRGRGDLIALREPTLELFEDGQMLARQVPMGRMWALEVRDAVTKLVNGEVAEDA